MTGHKCFWEIIRDPTKKHYALKRVKWVYPLCQGDTLQMLNSHNWVVDRTLEGINEIVETWK